MKLTTTSWKELSALKGEPLVNKSTELRTHWLSLKLDKHYNRLDDGFHHLVGNILHEGGHFSGLMINYEAMFEGNPEWDSKNDDALRIAMYKLIPYIQMAEYIIANESPENGQCNWCERASNELDTSVTVCPFHPDKGKPCPDCEGVTDDPLYTCTTCWCQGGDGVL